MPDTKEPLADLVDRVAALERTVASLERRVGVAAAPDVVATTDRASADPATKEINYALPRSDHAGIATPGTATPASETSAIATRPIATRSTVISASTAPFSRPRPTLPMLSADPGQWVNRLGIALLLLGAAFGFKYSIDRGWIGPALRVLFGLSLGAVLLLMSGRVRQARRGLSRVLAGGGIACGYLSIFAAFHLYLLIPHGVAFVAMSLVTVAAFAVAVRSDDAMASVIGTIGGLATPVLLSSGSGNLAGLIVYACLVVTGAGAVFARRGWRVLLWTTALGGWMLFAAAAEGVARGAGSDAVAVQLGILFLALATWWLSVMREMLTVESPALWRPTTAGLGLSFESPLSSRGGDWAQQHHQLTLGTPVLVLTLSAWTWKLDEAASGWIALSLAVGWCLAALHLRTIAFEQARHLATTHAMAAAVMVAFAMSFLLGDDASRVGLAAEALAVLVLASRSNDRQPALLGHLLLAIVSIQTFGRLGDNLGSGAPGLHSAEFADLAVVVALAAAASLQSVTEGRATYFVAFQAGLLLWLLRVLDPLANGAAYVTATWFLDAIVLVVAGLRRDSATLRKAGAAVMALTMAKLFVLDLATVDAGWRIVTFLGFGAVLLGLGYAFPALWKRDDATANDGA